MAVVLYARVSTVRQAEKDLSIPDQLRQLREWCKAKGYQITQEYVEAGASATDDRRPVFQQMVSDASITPAIFDAIIIHSFSRFFRDHVESGYYKRRLKKWGVKVISITQEVSDNPAGEMIEGVIGLFDEYQSKENGKHTLRAMKENARQGYCNGASPPFGYQTVDLEMAGRNGKKKKLVINPAEAKLVKRIFELYIYGNRGCSLGFLGIAALLNQGGVTKRGKEWSKSSIYEVLQNPVYIGKNYFNRHDNKTGNLKPESEWILVEVPPIVEESIFLIVQQRKKQNSFEETPPMYVNSPTLLTGLIKCGECGSSMTLATGKSGRYKYYKCTSKINKHKDACSTANIPMQKLDGLILATLAEKVLTPNRLMTIFKGFQSRFKNSETANHRKIKELQKELGENKLKVERLYHAVENGMLPQDDSLMERAKRFQTHRQEILIEVAQLQRLEEIPLTQIGEKHIEAFCKELKRRFKDVKTGLGKEYLKALVDKITVIGEKIEITGSYANLAYAIAGNGEVPRRGGKWLPGPDSNQRRGG